ncbi:hypothetical protein [Acuticoccus sp. I52.16.1]|uniref:hypothetical protein n=1 Tax=Acuticoccus sp. I52.16.1 TaxID=2928472 RepID=UPI001FD17D27|nr:hypothetical protein [Acuticoccus sp. I52.16.1]UOM37294.1 hypothetical protein MRB58_24625 [Acuticoccus sp. I52.16.1]
MFHPTLLAPCSAPRPAPVDPGALRRRLRGATAEAHGTLDQRFAALTDPAERQAYRAFLRMNEACHAVLEGWLAGAGAGDASLVPAEVAALRRPLAAELASDVAAAGLARLAREPLEACLAGLGRGLPEATGVVYVLDGSRLGARMILKGWSRRQDGSEPAIAYLTAAAAASGPVFAAFDALSARLDPCDVERTAAAAHAAFKLFERASALTDGPAP